MCGRYRIRDTEAVDALTRRLFGIPAWATGPIAPRYNIAPSQEIAALTRDASGAAIVRMLRWGLIPAWAPAGPPSIRPINAQSETVATKAMFRQAFERRRCLVPADGFYEWQRVDATRRQPFDIHLRGGRPFFLAGIYEEASLHHPATCAILTTRANPAMARVHDRMPALLEGEAARRWLEPGSLAPAAREELTTPVPDEALEFVPVSTIVNSPSRDVPECLEPVTPLEATPPNADDGQGLLF